MDVRRIYLSARSLIQRTRHHTRIYQASAILVFVVPNLALSLMMGPASPAVRTTAHAQKLVSFVDPGLLREIDASNAVPIVAPTTPAVAVTTVAPAPAAVQAPAPVAEQVVDTSSAAAWAASPGVACIREHESGANYAEDTGNGYYGAYQDALSTWESHGGTGLPNDAPPAVQDQINYEIWQTGGWGQWGTAGMCGL